MDSQKYMKSIRSVRHILEVPEHSRVFKVNQKFSKITITVRNFSNVLETFQQFLDLSRSLRIFQMFCHSSRSFPAILRTSRKGSKFPSGFREYFPSFQFLELLRSFRNFLVAIATSYDCWKSPRYILNLARPLGASRVLEILQKVSKLPRKCWVTRQVRQIEKLLDNMT